MTSTGLDHRIHGEECCVVRPKQFEKFGRIARQTSLDSKMESNISRSRKSRKNKINKGDPKVAEWENQGANKE